jgi:ribosome-binding factor A
MQNTRTNEIIAREMSALLHRDYREESTLITITRANVASDLRNCTIFFLVPDDMLRKTALQFFKKFGKKLRYQLAQRIELKYFPELHFRYDGAQEKELRVQQIADSL